MEALSQGPGSHTQNVALEGVGGLGTPGCRLGGAGSSEARAEAEAGRHVLQTEESGAWGGLGGDVQTEKERDWASGEH